MNFPAALLFAGAMAAAQDAPSGSTPADAPPVDSLPAFKPDSTKSETIKSIEAGGGSAPPASAQLSSDSLDAKRRARRPFLGLSLALSFSDFSAKSRFSARLDTVARRDSLRILQKYDPVHFSFPFGLTLGIPVLPYADVWLRSEHFWYRVSALAQGDGGAQEFFYAVQAHLLGVGARYLLPISLMSVTGRPGIFFAYTHFWHAGPTEIYAPTGKVRARPAAAGAGYEIQAGFQQDYGRRFTLTGGLSFAALDFRSRSSWRAILPEGPDAPARWGLNSLRLNVLGLYQFGKK